MLRLFDPVLPEPYKVFGFAPPCGNEIKSLPVNVITPMEVGQPHLFKLGADTEFYDWLNENWVTIEKGFMWDGATAPTKRQRGLIASCYHDFNYGRKRARCVSDKQFAQDLRLLDAQPLARVWVWYILVRLFGWRRYGK